MMNKMFTVSNGQDRKSKLRRSLVLAFLVFNTTFLFSQDHSIEQSSVNFKIKNFGTFVKGTFSESTISGYFDLYELEKSQIKVIIKVASIDTGITKRDKHLLEDDYFDESTYPSIEFSSNKIEKKSQTEYLLHGKLTIKNTLKEVKIPLQVKENNTTLMVTSEFELSRKNYGVGGRSWILSDKVKARVQFKVRKK
ncbi:MAG: YceI family protein [Flavobacteriaceae bacterium]|nr:YceI family protein [Flavobacteriaceae bacterium]